MKEKQTSKLPDKIDAKTLASIAGMTVRRLYQLAETSEIPKAENGEFPFRESLLALFRYHRRDSEKLRTEKLAFLTARREREQLRLGKEAGGLAEIALLQKITDAVVIHWRDVILQAPISEETKAKILKECQNVNLVNELEAETGKPWQSND